MKRRWNTSFAKSFTTITLLMILFIKLILSLIFFIYLRSIVINLTETNTKNNVAYSKELIVSGIKEHEQALSHAAAGIAYLFRQSNVSAEEMMLFFNDLTKELPDILDIYFTNNRMWNQTGGFAVFGSGWIPDNDWDNTNRRWFTDAKKAEGDTAYSQPYVDADTGDIVVTFSKAVFNGSSDIGVIAADVTVNSLWGIINSVKSDSNQEIYIINADGLFIAHEDIGVVLKKDFFTEKNIEMYRQSVLNETEFIKIDKNQLIYSSAIPQTEWTLVSVIPSAAIFSSTNLFTMRLVIFTIVMFICVTTVTLFTAYRTITMPLTNIMFVSDALANNDFNVKITKFRNDEIGALQDSLIKIRDSLKSNIESLQKQIIEKE
ncbi:MAG: hypothetical protein FWB73_05900 [Treponema sp.]|nr:hypothetical protein [Treponema sp.]